MKNSWSCTRSMCSPRIFARWVYIVTSLLLVNFFLVTPINAQQVLSLQDVLAAASARYPTILEAKQKLRQAEASRLSADGAFDFELQQQSRARTSGYYSGVYANQKIVKPLAQANAKVFAEYRFADGQFPIYEDEFVTLDGGEISVGLSFSLLRDRKIDPNRVAIANADLEIEMEKFRQQAIRNKVQFDAAMAYLAWLNAYQQLTVYQSLLDMAKLRQEAMTDRVRLGHAAEIELLDHQQNLLKREAMVLSAENEMALRAVAVSFFWRDAVGKPQAIDTGTVPTLPRELSNDMLTDLPSLIHHAMLRHPDINYVDTVIAQTENKSRLYKNEMLPSVDVYMKAGHDLGVGSETRDGLESYVGLEFAMPLERRAAKGKIHHASAKIKELGYVRQRLNESVMGTLQQAYTKHTNAKAQGSIALRRAKIAQQLFQQEQQRFLQGASDIFLLNMREESTAEAQIDVVSAELQVIVAGIELLGYAYQMDKAIGGR